PPCQARPAERHARHPLATVPAAAHAGAALLLPPAATDAHADARTPHTPAPHTSARARPATRAPHARDLPPGRRLPPAARAGTPMHMHVRWCSSSAGRPVLLCLPTPLFTSMTLNLQKICYRPMVREDGCLDKLKDMNDITIDMVLAENTNRGVDRSVECTGYICRLIKLMEQNQIERFSEDQEQLKFEMTNLQQVPDNGKNEPVAHVGVVERQFQED
ncbi:hypothetical protein U9M48_032353, partial [Paspalum notatum var. saurae]